MNKIYIGWHEVETMTQEILRQMHQDQWQPDYVVGLTRGGLVPANLISQYLEVPMYTLKVSLRDDSECETNCWMATDAFGIDSESDNDYSWKRDNPGARKNILIVDDINDSGATLNWIRQDWQSGCYPDSTNWADVWGNNVRIAVLVDNQSSDNEIEVSYTAKEVNKLEDPQWIVFPWEDWWQR
jgi:hypoxanthine phosphoribosyltransferase